jgi:hypothetical protein
MPEFMCQHWPHWSLMGNRCFQSIWRLIRFEDNQFASHAIGFLTLCPWDIFPSNSSPFYRPFHFFLNISGNDDWEWRHA